MNAFAMPISSRTSAETSSICRWTKSPRIFEERPATSWATLASSSDSFLSAGCIPHDAIIAQGTPGAARIVQVVQMGYRLAHCEKSLVRVERAAKKHTEQLGCALRGLQRMLELGQAVAVMVFQLFHAPVRAAEGLAVRGQHQHVLG